MSPLLRTAGLRKVYPWLFDKSGEWREMTGSADDFESEATAE